MAYTQADRLIAINTPLGQDVLLLQGFTGHEGISRLFSFQLDFLSENPSIAFDKIVGQRASVRVLLADGEKRYINGFISRFVQRASDARFTYYQAEMVPWLWFLTRTTDCRIFQNMTVPDIIKKIFTDLGFNDFKSSLQKNYEPRDYCVQYRETDFNFVSRLMEQAGIFYFFEHEENKHTLVLGDFPSANRPCKGQEKARCEFGAAAYEEEDVITGWQLEHELRPGKYALTDYNFETPSTSLGVNLASKVNVGGNSKYEVYDYPGEYLKKGQGEGVVKTRMEEEEAQSAVVSGSSTCRAFTSGFCFDLSGHSRSDMNKCYVLTSVQHTASVGDCYVAGTNPEGGEFCTNHFSCIPHDVPFRPARVTPRPIVQGPQTAVVVGPGGEEIYTDRYGRVKVQFHWDREGKRDENSSCWIRVSHPWAGKGWGSVSIPRIGQEVIVDFLEGDPDQPIVTGRVYNAETMPPYGLPAGGVVSGIKSNTHKGKGYNEMSMDDTAKKEKITIHAQYDMGTTIEHDDTQHIVTGNRKIDIDTGTHTETIKGNTTITIVSGAYSLDVQANTHTHHVKGLVTENYDASQSTTVAHEVLIDAGDKITLHTGLSKITMESNGTITIHGKNLVVIGDEDIKKSAPKVEITGGNEAKIGVGNQNTVFDKQMVATSGAAINSSAKGMHEITGAVVKIN